MTPTELDKAIKDAEAEEWRLWQEACFVSSSASFNKRTDVLKEAKAGRPEAKAWLAASNRLVALNDERRDLEQ